MDDKPKIFLSHNWSNKSIAEQLYTHLTEIGIMVHMDNHELKYKDSIKKFMQSIRDCDYAVLLIGDEYLKSKNCLFEVLQLMKDKNFEDKILPITLDSAKIYDTSGRVAYIKYWQDEQIKLKESLSTIDPIYAIDLYNELKVITEIVQSIDTFLSQLGDMLNITLAELQKQSYKPLLEKIGYEDLSYAIKLLHIALLDDVDERELALDEYLTQYPPNTHYHAIKAKTYKMAHKYKQAKFSYLESIKIDPTNTASLNNLGYLLDISLGEYNSAKEYYEKAIFYDPKHTIARLNLGVLLSHRFNDVEGAQKQYEAILEYEDNPKAYNNISNYYKSKGEYKKAGIFSKRAIDLNPYYFEAYLTYGNSLKLAGDTNKGNFIYSIAKSMTKDEGLRKLLDVLMSGTKG